MTDNPFLVPHLYGRGTLVLGFETSINRHFIISLNPLKGEAHVGAHVEAHVFKVLEACLFNTTHRPGMAVNGRGWPGMAGDGRGWPGMAGDGRGWPGMAGNGREWPGMAGKRPENVGEWPGMAGNCRGWPGNVGE